MCSKNIGSAECGSVIYWIAYFASPNFPPMNEGWQRNWLVASFAGKRRWTRFLRLSSHGLPIRSRSLSGRFCEWGSIKS